MKTLQINGTLRKELGKKSALKLRKSNNIPCILYGGKENVHFYTPESSFLKLIYTSDVHLVNIKLDSSEYSTILKEVQFHPVTDRIIHADFIKVTEDKPVTISLPVYVTGDSAGVKAGGKLKINKLYLTVKGLIKDFPDHITIDITELNIHDSVKVGDISLENVEILEPKNVMVLNIATSRVAQKTEEAEAEVVAEAGAAATAEQTAEKGAEKTAEEKK
ncbi:MAG: 50S ribosomal protein L25/general stress protein Ctc [Bacteroidales bacterium]